MNAPPIAAVFKDVDPGPLPGGRAHQDDWADEHVRMLRELAELGMELARAMARQALAQAEAGAPGEPAAGGPGRGDPGLAFARVARAVRLTLALEARTREGSIARRAPVASEAEGPAAGAAARIRALLAPMVYGPREAEVRRIAQDIIEAEGGDRAEALMAELHERLDDHEGYAEPDRPMGESLARICRDLGLTPDWSRWADQDWAAEAAAANGPGSPRAAGTGPAKGWPRDAPSAVMEGGFGGVGRPLGRPPDSG
jgi:hypothetical protein